MSWELCEASASTCGTASGWRMGGRCPRCRAAHNAETRQYSGMSARQRETVLNLLREGGAEEEAAKEVGRSVKSLRATARADGELFAALEGRTVAEQVVARQGDYLAMLTRVDGDLSMAAQALGLAADISDVWRAQSPQYAAAEEAVLRLVVSGRPPQFKRKMKTDAELDEAAGLLEQGKGVTEAARAIGISATGLRAAGERHARLAQALPPKVERDRAGAVSGLTEEVAQELRRLWADKRMSRRSICVRLGVSQSTVTAWVKSLGLPARKNQRWQ
ncbi:hypothetical protein [Streptomyces sp. SAJ15]|uniref:hypothetical protein n=1 Tax=Streptomyces sp. SAJ15 TaxID=2011095 RepID=UPI0011868B70|nr:hypothetical protein [Streptomyces sp. SAJ15]TVL89796.1 hypothetical protein CD790_25710 [Streptomyces sp. SAJ15]